MGYIENVAAAKAALAAAEKEYAERVRKAESDVSAAKRVHEAAIHEIDKAGKAEDRDYAKRLASFGGASLYADHITYKGTDYSLLGGADAQIDLGGTVFTSYSGGGRKFSLAGAVVGGAIAGPLGALVGGDSRRKITSEVHDDRTLYLTIATSDGAFGIEAKPDAEGRAREFAAKVTVAADNAVSVAEQHIARLEGLAAQLDAAKADTSAVDAAEVVLEHEKADRAALDAAREEYERVRASGTDEEQEELAAHERRGKGVKIGIAAVVLVAAIALAIVARPFAARPSAAPDATAAEQAAVEQHAGASEPGAEAGAAEEIGEAQRLDKEFSFSGLAIGVSSSWTEGEPDEDDGAVSVDFKDVAGGVYVYCWHTEMEPNGATEESASAGDYIVLFVNSLGYDFYDERHETVGALEVYRASCTVEGNPARILLVAANDSARQVWSLLCADTGSTPDGAATVEAVVGSADVEGLAAAIG